MEVYVDDTLMYGNATLQGPTMAFNVLRKDGSYVPWSDVERVANSAGVFVRAGGKSTFPSPEIYYYHPPVHLL